MELQFILSEQDLKDAIQYYLKYQEFTVSNVTFHVVQIDREGGFEISATATGSKMTLTPDTYNR
jgi:hypothetical protein